MTAPVHKRSVQIDAPVEKVFDFVKDPRQFWEAWLEESGGHTALAEVNMTPEGVGSTYRMMGRTLFLFHMEWVITREEYVPNERIVDHAWLGRIILTVEPADPTGTTLSMAWEWSTKVPLVGGAMDRFSWGGDRELDQVLANVKKAIEA